MNDAERDSALTITELKGGLKALQERMNTMQAEYRTDIARLAEDMAKRSWQQLVAVIGALAVAVTVLSLTLSPDPQTPIQPIVIQMPPSGPDPLVSVQPAPQVTLPDAAASEPSAPDAERQPDG